MKKRPSLFLVMVLFGSFSLCAQDYLSGKLVDSKANEQEILYDRTQFNISPAVFQTVYKVFSIGRKPLFSITLTHDQQKTLFFISIKPEAGTSKGKTIRYDKTQCGLIFSEQDNMDTTYAIGKEYVYLLSFTDTVRDYPVLHKIRSDEDNALVLDPLSKLRIRKHNEIVRAILLKTQPAGTNTKTETITATNKAAAKRTEVTANQLPFNAQLLANRDSLYARFNFYSEKISDLRNLMEFDIAQLFDSKKVFEDETKYEGERKGGKPDGKGLLAVNGNLYDGVFKAGKFLQGKVALKTNNYDYYGEYSNDTLNGTGWMKYRNGSFLLGIFTKGILQQGVLLERNNGEIYYGNGTNNQRNGYGELQGSNGGKYYGDFLNGRLVRGYAKETDQFGYSIYSRIENGTKTAVESSVCEEFFNLISSK